MIGVSMEKKKSFYGVYFKRLTQHFQMKYIIMVFIKCVYYGNFILNFYRTSQAAFT